MKRRIVLIVITAVILLSGILTVIFINRQPTLNALGSFTAHSVSGNGGTAVTVDDYLYFIDGYVDYTKIVYKQNDYYYNGKVQDGAIYRVKLVNGAPEYIYDNTIPEQDEDAAPIQDEDGDGQYDETDEEHYNKKIEYIKNVEVIVPKIAGHGATALWVYGNTLIYTSPNNMKNNVGTLQSGRLDFFKVNINRDSKTNVKLYTSENTGLTVSNFSVVYINGQIYLLINDNGKLIRVDINGKTNVIEEKVTNVVFPKVTAYMENSVDTNLKLDKAFNGVMQYVYFTKTRDENDTLKGNKMYRCFIADFGEQAEEIAADGNEQWGYTYTPLAAGDGRFIFTAARTDASSGIQPTLYMSFGINDDYRDLTENSTMFRFAEDISGTKFYLRTQITGEARLLILSGTKLYVGEPAGKTIAKGTEIVNDVSEVLAATANRIYYQDTNSSVKAVELENREWKSVGVAVSVSGKNENVPVSVVQPFGVNGGTLSGAGRLVFIMEDITDKTETEAVESGIELFLWNEKGTKYTLYTKTHRQEG
jgi:hypothetical protein